MTTEAKGKCQKTLEIGMVVHKSLSLHLGSPIYIPPHIWGHSSTSLILHLCGHVIPPPTHKRDLCWSLKTTYCNIDKQLLNYPVIKPSI